MEVLFLQVFWVLLTQSKYPDLVVGSIVFFDCCKRCFSNIKTWQVMKPIFLKSIITCPECGFQKEENDA